MRCSRAGIALLPLLLIAVSQPARSEDPSFSLTLKDHRFTPAELTVPANVRVRQRRCCRLGGRSPSQLVR
jgi:hypothetical protein